MFRRRKTSNPPPVAAPNPSAASAATQAFFKNQSSDASLSSAAAAAALRSHTPPPTNPGDIQTKRMVRRDSNSSRGSAAGRSRSPMSPPPLQRTNSNGSMTERTFRSRSPSPNRKDTAVLADPNAPPVPAIPKQVSAPRKESHRRSASSEMPQRLSSPQTRPGGRGMSADAGNRQPVSDRRVVSMSQLTDLDTRSGTKSPVNFSRPMSPPQTPVHGSPVQPRAGKSGWFAGPVTTGAQMRQTVNDRVRPVAVPTSVQTGFTQQAVQLAANKPVSKRKSSSQPPQGTRLAQAISDMDSQKPTMVFDRNTRRMVPVQAAPTPAPAPVAQPMPAPAPEPVPQVSTTLAAKVQKGTSPTVEKGPPLRTKATSPLKKQPSVVREEAEEEEEPQAAAEAPKQHIRSATVTLAQPTPTRAREQHYRSASLEPGNNVPKLGRSASLSPARNAHFSAAPVTILDGLRHDPPPRSLSPAKPALKQSPASSVRTGSPVTSFATPAVRPPPSDVSVSGSEEGSATRQRKKSARVSFGDEPVEIIPDASSPPSGLMSSRYATRDPTFDDGDEFELSPRPVLPSFGSMRGRLRQTQPEPEPVVKVTETVPSSMSTSISTLAPESLEHSSDHAISGILVKDRENRRAKEEPMAEGRMFDPNEPLPPEVTSVEGSGYVSDSDSSEAEQLRPEPPEEPVIRPEKPTQRVPENIVLPAPETKGPPDLADARSLQLGTEPGPEVNEASELNPEPRPERRTTVDVPTIAVLPATPAAAEEDEDDEYLLVMPGGFAGSWTDDEPETKPDAPKTDVSDAQKETETQAFQPAAAVATEKAPQLEPPHVVDEDASDGDSIYSDAEEDLSEPEGYASLDAIVESPTEGSPLTSRWTSESSPLKTVSNVPPSPTDWAQTKAFWSGLSERQKQDLEVQANPQAVKQTGEPEQPRPPKKKKKKTAVAAVAPAPVRTAPKQRPQRSPSDPPKEEFHLRTSMRNRGSVEEPQRPETHLRSSLRTGGTMPTSMRGAQRGLETSRYSHVPAYEPRASLQKKSDPLSSASAATASRPMTAPSQPATRVTPKPALLRSDSSDSASSFRRQRPQSVMSDGEGYTMRRSMRGGEQPKRESRVIASASPPPTRPSTSSGMESPNSRAKRFSFRSLSPTGNLMSKRNPVRSSLDDTMSRPSTAQPTHRETLRGPKVNKDASGRAFAPVPPPPKPALRTGGLYKSRYADDSDDDSPAALRTNFRSRFADSDDEDGSPAALQALTPVRGIPRKPGHEDGDSTDLEDENSGDEVGGLRSPKSPKLTNGNKAEGGALAAGSLRGLDTSKHAAGASATMSSPLPSVEAGGTPKKEKRGFFSLGRKKRPSSVPPPQPNTVTEVPSKAAKLLGPSEGPRSPKLQRRVTPQSPLPALRRDSDAWPLPTPRSEGEREKENPLERPGTADGPPNVGEAVTAGEAEEGERPEMGKRRSTVDGSVGLRFAESDSVVGEGAGPARKKKKFGVLRRAFRLDD